MPLCFEIDRLHFPCAAGTSTYLHRLKTYMVRVRLQDLLKLRYYGAGVCTLLLQIKLPARGSTYALQWCQDEVCTSPVRAYTQYVWEGGQPPCTRSNDNFSVCAISAERNTLHWNRFLPCVSPSAFVLLVWNNFVQCKTSKSYAVVCTHQLVRFSNLCRCNSCCSVSD